MALCRFSGLYLNPADVAAIFTGTDSTQANAYYMNIHLRDGKEYKLTYGKETSREADAIRLSKAVNLQMAEPVTIDDVKDELDKVKGAIRRDIKALREALLNDNTAPKQ